MTDTNTEKLKFKLELWSTHWNKTPVAEILINDTSHYRAEITGIANGDMTIYRGLIYDQGYDHENKEATHEPQEAR